MPSYAPISPSHKLIFHQILLNGTFPLTLVNISYYQAVRWARKHKTHVISWKMKHTDWKGAPQQEDMLMDAMNDPAFYQFFVSGAPAYTTGNINPGLNIANGSHLTLHSLILASPQQEAQLKSLN